MLTWGVVAIERIGAAALAERSEVFSSWRASIEDCVAEAVVKLTDPEILVNASGRVKFNHRPRRTIVFVHVGVLDEDEVRGHGVRIQAELCYELRPHLVDRRSGASQGSGEVGELAQQRAGVAGVDDLFDPERLRRAERGAQLVEAVFDLGHLRLTV